MARWDPVTVVAFLVVVVLAISATGVDLTSDPATAFGDGNATVGTVNVDTQTLRITDGRFGTDVSYLRIPSATVTLTDVVDRPRLVYVVSLPVLDVERIETTVVTSDGTSRLVPDQQAIRPDRLEDQRYAGSVTVRLQSFTTDRTIYHRAVSVEVTP